MEFGRRESFRPAASNVPEAVKQVLSPEVQRWRALKEAAKGDQELDDLLGAFAGISAMSHLHPDNKDSGAISDRLEDINRYLTTKGLPRVDNLKDLPPISSPEYAA